MRLEDRHREQIQAAIKAQGLTQQAFSRQMGHKWPIWLSKVLRGRVNLTWQSLERILAPLGLKPRLEIDNLIGGHTNTEEKA